MSKMNEMSITEQEEAYAQMIEEERNELRREGAQELLIELERVKALVNSGTGLYQFVSISPEGVTSRNFVDLRGLV